MANPKNDKFDYMDSISLQLKTIQQIDEEIKEDNFLEDICRESWDERKKDLKEKVTSFSDEMVKENPLAIKRMRLEFLEQKFEELNQEYIKRYKEMEKFRNEFSFREGMGELESSLYFVYNEFADLIENGRSRERVIERPPYYYKIRSQKFLPDIAQDIKKISFEINMWNNPQDFYQSGGVSELQIELATEFDCSTLIDFSRKDGNRFWARCPFHEEKTPSFCYFKDTKKFHCFSCGWHGSAIDVVQKLKGLDFISAVNFILKNNG